jgi:16S rRNA C967 or C1407 C5-methylase (RsmB/RsmF family)
MELPDKFIEYITKLNAEVLNGLCDTLANTAPSVSVRPNRLKGITAPEGARRVPWHDAGFYLAEREQFTFDPAMHQGLYYVQDASSMIVGTIVAKLTGDGVAVRYLDACAAPGGKTTAAIDALPTGSLVVANEYVPQRAAILAENVMKWGYPRIVVTRGDTARYTKLPAFFDIIATDVPCSGEGMMRKDAEAVAQWSPALVEECAQRQRMIVDNLWGSLRTGGYLIYSTCTFNGSDYVLYWFMFKWGLCPIFRPGHYSIREAILRKVSYHFVEYCCRMFREEISKCDSFVVSSNFDIHTIIRAIMF